ncbi:hypothetical protein L1887_07499 [Cichorium endivia]|nr:hypothetical protein L1887_07499 [Cichorium endivia]
MGELPVEIMYDILSRMPVKSLDRFRCVCKDWCKYIDEPNLAIIQMNRAVEEAIPVMLKMHPDRGTNILTLFRIIQSKQGDEAKKDSVLEFECKEPFYDYNGLTIEGSCNGLLYLSTYSMTRTFLSVIHPLRNERYELPPTMLIQSCGLGFDASTNTFKMCVSLLENWKIVHTMVHVLGTDSWREVTQIPYYLMEGKGIFAHACLHWLGSHYKRLSPNQRIRVISFDIRKEEFRLIDPPRKTGDHWIERELVDLHGKVGLVYISTHSFSIMELWVLKENDEWVIQCQFDTKPLLLPHSHGLIEIVGLWNNSGDILVTIDGHGAKPKRLFVYSLKTGGFLQVNLVGWEDPWGLIHMYRSSLFSVQGMKKSTFLCSYPTDLNFCSSKKEEEKEVKPEFHQN